MKHFIIIVSASLLALPLFGQEKSPQLKDQKDKVSYSAGINMGFNFQRQNDVLKRLDSAFNVELFIAGMKDAIAGKPQLTPDQVKEVMAQFEKDLQQKQKALS